MLVAPAVGYAVQLVALEVETHVLIEGVVATQGSACKMTMVRLAESPAPSEAVTFICRGDGGELSAEQEL
jgi:glucose-6-phosphate dehydrogenase assembly protein OpcA